MKHTQIQFKAAYIVDSIANVIAIKREEFYLEKNKLHEINGLLQCISAFDVEFPYKHELDFENLNPVLAVLNNILTRGLPTLAPLTIEETFKEIALVEDKSDDFEYKFSKTSKEIDFQTIFELMHIIEPQLSIPEENYGGKLGSQLEWKFLKKHPFFIQILESQKDFKTINEKVGGGRTVDFCFISPYIYEDEKKKCYKNLGRIFEIDGPHHLLEEFRYYDTKRDDLAKVEGFETLRFNEIAINSANANYDELIGIEIYRIFEKNYQRNHKELLEEYSLIFIPLAVARVQKTLIEYFLFHKELLIAGNKIKIAVVERDFPCGALAVNSLQDMVTNLNEILIKDHLNLPEIELTIFENENWQFSEHLHLGANRQNESFFNDTSFDLVIDHAILRRSNVYNENDFIAKPNTIKIRSSHFFDTNFGQNRRTYCANLLTYKPLVEKRPDGSYKPIRNLEPHINYFIKNIFRKKEYREGQLPIISRALQQKPVIGLLPTGAGKSLTYQLPTLLQPALTIIVDPIKSLMEDQVRVLKENWIDTCDFINSNLKREEKNKKLIDFKYGENQFFFISPERFVMEDFRNIIENIDNSPFGLAFSYCVIDEVHCVSEWGHDFRSTYLILGKNAQKFTKTRNGKSVCLMGLTATASFDVLSDIEREIQIQGEEVADAIIMIENTIRPELFFRVVDATGFNRIGLLNEDFKDLGKRLNTLNNKEFLEASQKHHFEEFERLDFAQKDKNKEPIKDKEGSYVFAYKDSFLLKDTELSNKTQNNFFGIVFCPVIGKKNNSIGVNYVFDNLDSDSKGFFYSADDDGISTEVQKNFKAFTTNKLQHIVCTKAFGMGIDKKDIRATYHYVYSSSLESLVQEAGRSGRDRQISEANILFSNEKVYKLSFECLFKYDTAISKIEIFLKDPFHRNQIRRIINTKDSFVIEKDLIDKIRETIAKFNVFIPGTFKPESMSLGEKERLNNFFTNAIISSYKDRGIHSYFHENNFRGIDTEKAQLHALIKDKEFQSLSKLDDLAILYNEENDTEYLLRFWEKDNFKRIYVETSDEEKIGFIDISLPLKKSTGKLEELREFLVAQNKGDEDLLKLVEVGGKAKEILNNGETLKERFEACEIGEFNFTIASEKVYSNSIDEIYSEIIKIENFKFYKHCETIKNKLKDTSNLKNCVVNTWGRIVGEENFSYFFNWFTLNEKYDKDHIEALEIAFSDKKDSLFFIELIFKIQIEQAIKNSKGSFWNFLLLLEENIKDLKLTFDILNPIERKLRFYYNRDRHSKPSNDTGRLIYRMHSMGFLTDYVIDYNKNLYECAFQKYDTIEEYVKHLEEYLKRYLSEKEASRRIDALKTALTNDNLVDNILECLYFLSAFSYKEIEGKRKRAADEVQDLLIKSISEEKYSNNWFEQNKFIKEEIYFYFNAKYARPSYKIENEPYSLLYDYETNRKQGDNALSKIEILEKYLGALNREGTPQNNYKHMIGSCKKILRSFGETEVGEEWLLRLLKAFSMYSVNNISYIKEANTELYLGFINLYEDEEYRNDLNTIEPIFESYFEKLLTYINKNNPTIKIIKMLRVDLLFKMQEKGIQNLNEMKINILELQ
jgi:ATP-dependent DNA helicase RecQ